MWVKFPNPENNDMILVSGLKLATLYTWQWLQIVKCSTTPLHRFIGSFIGTHNDRILQDWINQHQTIKKMFACERYYDAHPELDSQTVSVFCSSTHWNLCHHRNRSWLHAGTDKLYDFQTYKVGQDLARNSWRSWTGYRNGVNDLGWKKRADPNSLALLKKKQTC